MSKVCKTVVTCDMCIKDIEESKIESVLSIQICGISHDVCDECKNKLIGLFPNHKAKIEEKRLENIKRF